LLSSLDVSELSLHLSLALLTISAAAKDQLEARSGFYDRVEQDLRDRGELEEGLLVGLD